MYEPIELKGVEFKITMYGAGCINSDGTMTMLDVLCADENEAQQVCDLMNRDMNLLN